MAEGADCLDAIVAISVLGVHVRGVAVEDDEYERIALQQPNRTLQQKSWGAARRGAPPAIDSVVLFKDVIV